MSTNPAQFEKWSDVLDYKARILYAQIASLQESVREQGGSDEMIDTLCEPYVELLKSMYTEDYPLAKAIEESDLVIRLEGPAIDRESPRISIITGVFTRVRKQVANVAKAIAQISDASKRIPKEMDLGLSAFAKGSLVLGFTLPSPEEIEEEKHGQQSLLGDQDPLYQAARQAIRTIGVVTQHVAEGKPLDELAEFVPDARVRDAALVAVESLAPTGRQGINSVSISGREISTAESETPPLTLTMRDEIHAKLKHPVLSEESVVFIGDVREIDLDARRFELRHIENMEVNDVRCSYVDETDDEAAEWLNKRVKVTGNVERDYAGKAKLLDAATIEITD
jgi:hypothetical protein